MQKKTLMKLLRGGGEALTGSLATGEERISLTHKRAHWCTRTDATGCQKPEKIGKNFENTSKGAGGISSFYRSLGNWKDGDNSRVQGVVAREENR